MDHQSHNGGEAVPLGFPEAQPNPPKESPEQEVFDSNKVEDASIAKAIEKGSLASPVQTTTAQPTTTDFPLNPLLNIPTDQPTATPTSVQTVTSDLSASDTDLIEKAWVTKAKAIVAQTKSDPRRQNNELNKIKADYQKKRYNRDLKINVE